MTYHGIAINLCPELSHFEGIVPCGIADRNFGVTSLADLGIDASAGDLIDAMRSTFGATFDARATGAVSSSMAQAQT